MRSGVANHGPKMYTYILKDHHEIELNLLLPFHSNYKQNIIPSPYFHSFHRSNRVDYKVLKWLII